MRQLRGHSAQETQRNWYHSLVQGHQGMVWNDQFRSRMYRVGGDERSAVMVPRSRMR